MPRCKAIELKSLQLKRVIFLFLVFLCREELLLISRLIDYTLGQFLLWETTGWAEAFDSKQIIGGFFSYKFACFILICINDSLKKKSKRQPRETFLTLVYENDNLQGSLNLRYTLLKLPKSLQGHLSEALQLTPLLLNQSLFLIGL